MYHVSVFNDCNYIFTFDKTNYLEFKEMGVKHIWYLPLAVDVDRIDMILQKSEDSVKYLSLIHILLAGAAVVTDDSTYLRRTFTDGKELVMFSLKELQTLPERVFDLFGHSSHMQELARLWISCRKRGAYVEKQGRVYPRVLF